MGNLLLEQLTEIDKAQEEPKSTKQKVIDRIVRTQEEYFRPKSFERSGKLYKLLGVKTYKKFLPTFGDYVAKPVCSFLGYKKVIGKGDNCLLSPSEYDLMTRCAEAIYLTIGSLMMGSILDRLYQGDYDEAIFGMSLNLLFNIYPIMTQRYNRAAIYRIAERRGK